MPLEVDFAVYSLSSQLSAPDIMAVGCHDIMAAVCHAVSTIMDSSPLYL